jgi:hypothetical protein
MLSGVIDLCESENEGRNALGPTKGLAFICRIAGWEQVDVREDRPRGMGRVLTVEEGEDAEEH